MNVKEAKNQIIELIASGLGKDNYLNFVSPDLPNSSDTGKLLLLGKSARVIHRFNGWNVPINLSWFSDSIEQPVIQGEEFYWYAFAIPNYSGFKEKHYFICDYYSVRSWVLDFKAPLGIDHKDHRYWRADIHYLRNSEGGSLGYFRWGDEPTGDLTNPCRIILLDNIKVLQRYSQTISYRQVKDLDIENEYPLRTKVEINRIVRDTALTKKLKTLYNNGCQICGLVIGFEYAGYSEAHHIRPLGDPHKGPDTTDNIIVLCPNHHVEFEYGFIAIDPATLMIIHVDPKNQYNGATLKLKNNHFLDVSNLAYHLKNIFILSS